jgi:hypothetical protein
LRLGWVASSCRPSVDMVPECPATRGLWSLR